MQLLKVLCAGKEEKSKGAFVRKESQHRNWIKADGSPSFTPEAGRYHLYVANGCPWCHRSVHFLISLVMIGLLYMAYRNGCWDISKVCLCACACLQVPRASSSQPAFVTTCEVLIGRQALL